MCKSRHSVLPGGYRDQTHFTTTMIAKIFMTNKKMGLEPPPATRIPRPGPLHLALCWLIKSINDLSNHAASVLPIGLFFLHVLRQMRGFVRQKVAIVMKCGGDNLY